MRSGTLLTELVEFSTGFPDGNITWELRDGRGNVVGASAVVPEADSVSAVITISGATNTIEAGALASPRELSWTYTVGGLAVAGRRRYRLEAFLPFGVSEDGVRRKVGAESHEIEDENIDLVGAFSEFRKTVTTELLDAVEGDDELIVCDAIEALAALALLPTLQILLVSKESSGTSQFQRDKIDWKALRAHLEYLVATGYGVVNPATDTTASLAPLLIAVTRADPVTGES